MIDPAATVAAAICWLSRQHSTPGRPGLPQVPELRRAVVNRHQVACGWCDYDPPALLRLIEEGLTDNEAVRRFERLPDPEQRRLVVAAQELELLA